MHLARVLSDIEWATVPLTETAIRALDATSVKVVNGDGGGLWSPSSPIVIGGTGVVFLGPNQVSDTGGGIFTSAGKHIVHGRLDADDYIALDPFHLYASRTTLSDFGPTAGDYAHVVTDEGQPTQAVSSRKNGTRFLSAPLRVHQNGTIDSVTLVWMVVQTHAAVPAKRPQLRIVRVDASGNVEPLRLASDTDLSGFLLIGSKTSGAAYTASNGPQLATYTVTETAKAKVDTSKYTYHAEIIEESGTGAFTGSAGNRYNILQTYHVAIPHLGPQ